MTTTTTTTEPKKTKQNLAGITRWECVAIDWLLKLSIYFSFCDKCIFSQFSTRSAGIWMDDFIDDFWSKYSLHILCAKRRTFSNAIVIILLNVETRIWSVMKRDGWNERRSDRKPNTYNIFDVAIIKIMEMNYCSVNYKPFNNLAHIY